MSLPRDGISLGGGDEHAIEVMALGVEWSPPLSDEVLERLINVYRERSDIAEFLPGKKHLQGLQIRLEGAASQIAAGTSSNLVDFTRSNPDGTVAWALSLRPDFMACNTSAYVGWKTSKPRLIGLLRPFLEVAISAGATIKAIGLQYVDAFRWKQKDGKKIAEILSNRTPWLPSTCFEHPFLWHVHQGWFTEATGNRRVLNNLNIDLQNEEPDSEAFVLKIHGQHRLQATSFGNSAPAQIYQTELESIADMLHKINKETLGSLLTQQMLNRIGLKTESGNVS